MLIPEDTQHPDKLVINDVQEIDKHNLKILFQIDKLHTVKNKSQPDQKSYMLIKLDKAPDSLNSVIFKSSNPLNPAVVNQSLGNDIRYTNILSEVDKSLFIEYLPLDKGNSWTYEFDTDIGRGEQTFSIISVTDGWSIYDSFFGKAGIGMKFDNTGNILISSKKGVSPFYIDGVNFPFFRRSR